MLDSSDGRDVSSPRKLLQVGVGEVVICDEPNAVLSARALGSCVALLAHDPRRNVGGVLHYLLPSSTLSRIDVDDRPGLFADTGVALLFDTLAERGCSIRDLVLKATGGARAFDDDSFDVGERNILALYVALAHRRMSLAAEALGGRASRTVRLHVGTGAVRVRCNASKQVTEL